MLILLWVGLDCLEVLLRYESMTETRLSEGVNTLWMLLDEILCQGNPVIPGASTTIALRKGVHFAVRGTRLPNSFNTLF